MTTYSSNYALYSISFGTAGRSTDITSEYWWNTWDDWHMVPTSRPVIASPKARTQYVTVPGRDGPLDYSEAIDGIHFDIFTGTWEFVVLHEFNEMRGLTWADIYSEILSALHGRELQVVLSEHSDVCYTGRIFVESWKSEDHASKVTLKYELDPVQHHLAEWEAMNTALCQRYYSGWLEFPEPFMCQYCSTPINRIGGFIRFEKPCPTIDKAAVYVSRRLLPVIKIRGAVKGLNVAHASIIPFVALNDQILATGETNPKLGMGTINAVRSSSTGLKKWYINPTYIKPVIENYTSGTPTRGWSEGGQVSMFRVWRNMMTFFDDNTVM